MVPGHEGTRLFYNISFFSVFYRPISTRSQAGKFLRALVSVKYTRDQLLSTKCVAK